MTEAASFSADLEGKKRKKDESRGAQRQSKRKAGTRRAGGWVGWRVRGDRETLKSNQTDRKRVRRRNECGGEGRGGS